MAAYAGVMPWSSAGVVASTLAIIGFGAATPPALGAASASGVRLLPCGEFIGTQPPGRGTQVVLGVVALPASPGLGRALQTARSGLHDPRARLFAKWGLVIRPRAHFRLIVPGRLRNQLSIGWGNANEGHVGTTVVVNRCTGAQGAKWLAYAGGYYVRKPICATLIVATGRHERQVRIGVGKACPGQGPPPMPTVR
jgi:hypothetical protein